ncbi:MFS transporter [Telmatospirillum sp.]|uniref:MFS transporter n=1 Tax=Telmatospirillum sp. TaxID=2079197 RepID=UPI00284A8B00|nr:MFS transporter [Telmatospirillum sp.]MDR3437804.1 MFS transporter [Telmatospirillum sp.]
MSSVTTPMPKGMVTRVVLSSFVGNSIEYYDFFVYGLAAALVFGKVFFPTVSPLAATLASFATFGVGFVARPLGGVFFGHLGDTIGRKRTLVITLLVMGTATALIGFLPTYGQVGVLAPVLLVLLRFLQGFAVGGEWGGAMLMVVESAPAKHRGLLSALPNTGGFSGQLGGTAIFALLGFLPQDQMLSWGWRIPFLISFVLVLFGLYLRNKLDETPVFKEIQSHDKGKRVEFPAMEVLRNSWRTLLLITALVFAIFVPFFLTTVFAVSYATTQLGIPQQTLLGVILMTCVLAFPSHCLFGWLSDKVGRRPIYIFGSLLAAISAFPFFYLLESGNFVLMTLGYVLLINVAHNSMNAVEPALFTELFGARTRYSGASMGLQLGAVVAGGFTPFIAKGLTALDGNRWTLVAAYVVVSCLISAVAAYIAPETSKRILTDN